MWRLGDCVCALRQTDLPFVSLLPNRLLITCFKTSVSSFCGHCCSSAQHPHLLEVNSIKLHQGNLIISEEQTNGGCLHDFIGSLHAAGLRQAPGGVAAEFAAARLCVARNVFQQMAIVVEFLHLHGLWGLGLTPRSFFLNWTPAKCLILKLRLPMLSLVTVDAAVAAVRPRRQRVIPNDGHRARDLLKCCGRAQSLDHPHVFAPEFACV